MCESAQAIEIRSPLGMNTAPAWSTEKQSTEQDVEI